MVLTGQFWSIYGEIAWGWDTSLNTKLVLQHLVRIGSNSIMFSVLLCFVFDCDSSVTCELFHTRHGIPSPTLQVFDFQIRDVEPTFESICISKLSYYTEISVNEIH